jgi:hypothetical protein
MASRTVEKYMAEWIDLGGMVVTLERQVAIAGNGSSDS